MATNNEKYSEAALRHFIDSETLATVSRWSNAGHLVGFAGECAIKYYIRSQFSPHVPHGHFPNITAIALKHLSGRRGSTMFKVLKLPNLMSGWDVSHRYASDIVIGQAEYNLWKTHAKRLLGAAGIRQ